jgi:hypothetical protein
MDGRVDETKRTCIKFRCPPELEPVLPKPIPAAHGLPGWFKALPQRSFNPSLGAEGLTVKKCPPFIDAMTYGYLMLLVSDLKVENGEFTWDRDVPTGGVSTFSRSPIAYHDPSQVAGTPFFHEDRFIIKFNNFWTIETPPGYSILITHPVNRADLPFTTLAGLVDTDSYANNFINFPAHWHDASFNGVLPKGTPIAQCLPVKRETWTHQAEGMSQEAAVRLHETAGLVSNTLATYRREFRAPKR